MQIPFENAANTSLPFQGGGQEGDGGMRHAVPIPTPTLPLKVRESAICQLIVGKEA
jgi:hypothetical protein